MCNNNYYLLKCTRKKSMFIEFENKIGLYCCAFNGSIIGKFCSKGFDKICKS